MNCNTCLWAHDPSQTAWLDVIRCVGLVAFELPLAYIHSDKFNQPIFGANNLSGDCCAAS